MINTPFQNRRNLADVKDVCLGIHIETPQDLMKLIATQVLDIDVAKVWEFNLLVEALGVAYHYGLVHGRAEVENAKDKP